MAKLLQTEQKTFDTLRPKLLKTAKDKFVLIKGKDLIGAFESQADAINQGYERFGNTPFFVKQVTEVDPTYNFMSGVLSI